MSHRYPRTPVARRRKVLTRGVCCYCGNTTGPFVPDHQIPQSRGGTNEIENLVCACVECNFEKSDLLVEEWAAARIAKGFPWPPLPTQIIVAGPEEQPGTGRTAMGLEIV